MSNPISRKMAKAGMRCKVRAFSADEPGTTNYVMVRNGVVYAYDDIAGHYTTIHSISERAQRRIVIAWKDRSGAR